MTLLTLLNLLFPSPFPIYFKKILTSPFYNCNFPLFLPVHLFSLNTELMQVSLNLRRNKGFGSHHNTTCKSTYDTFLPVLAGSESLDPYSNLQSTQQGIFVWKSPSSYDTFANSSNYRCPSDVTAIKKHRQATCSDPSKN